MEQFISYQVHSWMCELEKLSAIARSHPQAAYAAFVHTLGRKWLYLARTIPGIGVLLQPLETAIRHKFIPALTG